MSRVVWGASSRQQQPQRDSKQQTTLDGFLAPQRRNRDTTEMEQQQHSRGLSVSSTQQQSVTSDAVGFEADEVLGGPSFGGNRETQGRRRVRPFMNGKERSEAMRNPYSRDFQREWMSMRAGEQQPQRQQTTEMDPALIAMRYCKTNCPKIFSGKSFFLNSCDADPLISVFLLEKVIRHLGGITTMGISRTTDFIVTQHVSSAKAKLLESGRAVHPHFIIDSAKAGKVLPLEPYLTLPHDQARKEDGVEVVAAVAAGAEDVVVVDAGTGSAENKKRQRQKTAAAVAAPAAAVEDVIEIE